MYNDPYSGITKPKFLYIYEKIIIDSNKYINVKLYEKNRIKYYEVVLNNNENEVFLGKYYENDSIFMVSCNKGKILIHNNQYFDEKGKTQIIEVLSLYDISDDVFYYCTEQEAVKLFDENLDTSSLKRKDKKLLRFNNRRKINYNENNLSEKIQYDKETKIIDLCNVLSHNNNNISNCQNDGHTKIIKFHK